MSEPKVHQSNPPQPSLPKSISLKVPANVSVEVPKPEEVVVRPFEESKEHILAALQLLQDRPEPNAVLAVGKLKGALEKLQAQPIK